LRAFDQSLQKLGLDYVDLYLLHWSLPMDFEKTVAAYKALEKLHHDKRIRAIGVSNFNPQHLTSLMERSEVVPAVNQIELHPYMTQESVQKANDGYAIKTECWSPIGGVFISLPKDPAHVVRVLEDPMIVQLGQKYRKTPAQIVLRWHNQHGRIVIPKSQHYERLLKNIEIFQFELSPEDLAAIDGLNRDLRAGPAPEAFSVAAYKAGVEKRKAALE
jgi:diketogulonate reductase-like aldo/keto reductase